MNNKDVYDKVESDVLSFFIKLLSYNYIEDDMKNQYTLDFDVGFQWCML